MLPVKLIVKFKNVQEAKDFAEEMGAKAYLADTLDFGVDVPENATWAVLLKNGDRPESCLLKEEVTKAAPEAGIQRALDVLSTAFSELTSVQQEYQDWMDNLPENLQSSALYEKLEMVCEVAIEDAESQASDLNADAFEGGGLLYAVDQPKGKNPSRPKRWGHWAGVAVDVVSYLTDRLPDEEGLNEEEEEAFLLAQDCLQELETLAAEVNEIELPLGFGRD